jgi:hypothetical protein
VNTTSAAPVASSTTDLTSALQDMVRQLLEDAPAAQAAAQPLCLCWVEGQS